MFLLYSKNGKCKISIIVFIAEEMCSWLTPSSVDKMEMLCVYGRVSATKFEVNTTLGCLVIALLLLIRYVTL